MAEKRTEIASIYRALHRDCLDRFNASRGIEWKVNVGLWAGILYITSEISGRKVLMSWWLWLLIALGIAILGFVLHYYLWMRIIQKSQKMSTLMAKVYENCVDLALRGEKCIVEDIKKQTKKEVEDEGPTPWDLYESAITAVIIFVSMLLLKWV